MGVVTESTVAVPFASCRQEFIGLQSLSKEFEKNGTDKRGRSLNHRGMGSYRLLKTLFALAVQGTLLFTTS